MLEVEEGDHAHEGVAMQAAPRSTLEVIKTKFLFELLMGFSHSHTLDRGSLGSGWPPPRTVPPFHA